MSTLAVEPLRSIKIPCLTPPDPADFNGISVVQSLYALCNEDYYLSVS